MATEGRFDETMANIQEHGRSHFMIVNPMAGRGRAARRLRKFRETTQTHLHVVETTCSGDAKRLAKEAIADGFQTIVAAGGDGTVHEVACGILESNRSDVVLGVLPIGSANDFSWSLRKHALVDGCLQIDVGRIQAKDGRSEYFVENVGMGLSGRVTVQSRQISWLQGMPLYSLAAIQAICRMASQPFRIRIDGAQSDSNTTLFSVLIGQREGSFVMAPDAKMDDGWFDFIHAFDVGKLEAMILLPRIAIGGPPRSHSKIAMGKCQRVEVGCESDLVIHTDGELFAVEGDGVKDVSIEIIPNRLQVLHLGL